MTVQRTPPVVPSAARALQQAARVLRADVAARVRAAGFDDITPAQLVVFRDGPDGRRPREIAANAGLSKQAVHDVLRELERAGYVRRERHPLDRRSHVVRLTERGLALHATVAEVARSVERDWAARIGEPEWRAFRGVLDAIVADGGG